MGHRLAGESGFEVGDGLDFGTLLGGHVGISLK